MKLLEKVCDLFEFKDKKDFYLAHCISADSGTDNRAMGAGVVVGFNKNFNMKNKIQLYAKTNTINLCDVILIDNVFNLITKPTFYSKPTYLDFENTIINLKKQCSLNNVKHLAIPLIGCGIDRLDWFKVKAIIEGVFANVDIEVTVCYYNQKDYDFWNVKK